MCSYFFTQARIILYNVCFIVHIKWITEAKY